MIAKLEPKKTNGSFMGLLRYLEREEAKNHDLERDEQVLYLNIAASTKEDAAAIMQATAAHSKRVKDPVMHFHCDWPHDEKPSEKEMLDTAKMMLKSLGMEKCQCCIIIHYDKRHRHFHVMANRVFVCPVTGRVKTHNPHQSQSKLHKCARQAELKYDWSHTKGLWSVVEAPNGEQQIIKTKSNKSSRNAKVADIEAQSGLQSFQSWVEESVKRDVYASSKEAKCWEELHSILAMHNLKLVKHKNGLVLVDVDDYNKDPEKVKFKVKASTIGSKFTKSSLEKKFQSEFTESSIIDYHNHRPQYHYNPETTVEEVNQKEIKKTHEAQALQMDFRKACTENINRYKIPREHAIKCINDKHKIDIDSYKQQVNKEKQFHIKAERKKLGRNSLPKDLYCKIRSQFAFKKREGIERLTEQKQADLEAVWQRYPKQLFENAKSYRDRETFVRLNAEDDDYEFREAARRAKYGYDNKGQRASTSYKAVSFECYIETVNVYTYSYKKNTDLFKFLTPLMTDDGVEYYKEDIKVFTDKGSAIVFHKEALADLDSVEAGFLMAVSQFNGNALTVHGSEEFKDVICRLAAKYPYVQIENEDLQDKIQQYKKELQGRWESTEEIINKPEYKNIEEKNKDLDHTFS
ncbi:TraI/MobA(P) family conjugative relaxase [Endozoicomonas ascidiicola]|uniref:TraI/MobA(P) family conjugative relaxase n=1 Tax=Endozoicomonas ascidiicola TaxID=1698521 RepID=UPI00083647D7|nr:TraI/MobA(P) family conjugative relaxase [Endozoicomonas ascidiicola]